MATKMTKKDYYARLADLISEMDALEDAEALLNFINHEVELLSKKSASTAPTKKQKDNAVIKDEIVSALKNLNKAVTVTELLTLAPNISEKVEGSNQRLTALLTQLSDPKYSDERVARVVEKKKAYFKAN